MELYRYNGTWITCGAYALIHATELDPKLLIRVENSAGATFGMSCMRAEWGCTRMLTPIRDFHSGIDEAAAVWGLESLHTESETPLKCDALLHAEARDVFVVGPVNMEALSYLPCSKQYRCADHYIALQCLRRNAFRLTDSEGIVGIDVQLSDLQQLLTGAGIPESSGKLHVRQFLRRGVPYTAEEQVAYIAKKAMDNLDYANRIGQGPAAFLACGEIAASMPMTKWHSALTYDMKYVIQRRVMMQELVRDACQICGRSDGSLPDLLQRQISAAALVLHELDERKKINFEQLAETEQELTERWKEWYHSDWD